MEFINIAFLSSLQVRFHFFSYSFTLAMDTGTLVQQTIVFHVSSSWRVIYITGFSLASGCVALAQLSIGCRASSPWKFLEGVRGHHIHSACARFKLEATVAQNSVTLQLPVMPKHEAICNNHVTEVMKSVFLFMCRYTWNVLTADLKFDARWKAQSVSITFPSLLVP